MVYYCKTDRLEEIFICDIEADRFSREEYLPSELRLAGMYHVSRNTIRRLLERLLADGILVRDENRRIRIRKQKKSVGSGKMSLAWAYAAYPDPMISKVTAGIHRYVREQQLELQIFSSHENHEAMLNALREAKHLGVDGVLLLNFINDKYTDCIDHLLDNGVSVVTVGPAGESRASSCCGDSNGVETALACLIEKYQRPVYLMSAPSDVKYLNWQGRYLAWCSAMHNAGFGDELEKYNCTVLCGDAPQYWSMEQKLFRAPYQFTPHLEKMKFPASVFCFNDYLARRLYLAAEEHGLVVGRDLMILSFDDLPFAARLDPPLSTIKVDSELLGYTAARLLHQSILKKFQEPVHLKIPSEFIQRNSF